MKDCPTFSASFKARSLSLAFDYEHNSKFSENEFRKKINLVYGKTVIIQLMENVCHRDFKQFFFCRYGIL